MSEPVVLRTDQDLGREDPPQSWVLISACAGSILNCKVLLFQSGLQLMLSKRSFCDVNSSSSEGIFRREKGPISFPSKSFHSGLFPWERLKLKRHFWFSLGSLFELNDWERKGLHPRVTWWVWVLRQIQPLLRAALCEG